MTTDSSNVRPGIWVRVSTHARPTPSTPAKIALSVATRMDRKIGNSSMGPLELPWQKISQTLHDRPALWSGHEPNGGAGQVGTLGSGAYARHLDDRPVECLVDGRGGDVHRPCEGKGDDRHIHIAGLEELKGLAHIFPVHQLRLDLRPEACLLQGFLRRLAVRGMVRVGDGNPLDLVAG